MIERAIQRVYGHTSPALRSSSRREVRTDLGLAAAALVVGLLVMPLVYAVFLPDGPWEALEGPSGWHLLLNGAANALVMLWSIRLQERYDRKLAGVLTRMLIVHGALAFFILTARQTYSNQVMLMAAAGSAVLGVLIMSIRHRTLRVRAAILGPWCATVEQLQIPCDRIDDPAADLSPYDVLLTASVTDLTPEWAKTLSKAMLMGKTVRLAAEYAEENQGQVSLDHFDLEHLPTAGLTSYRTRKRLMDIGLVLLSLPIALPILLIGALIVLATMGRPVMFVQSRVGMGGAPFQMYKLRTMSIPAVVGEARATGSRNDARITPAGRWLRRFRVDELPQLWNVLIGDMSIIGPRPEWTLLSERYEQSLPAYAYRHLVRPGITGWAQVKGGYASDLSETRAKVGYDLFYIKNLSFSLDIQILARTIWTLLTGSGAR